MSGSLARYHARSPRYTLNTQDNSLVRFSGAERFSWEEKTELMNISLTGLSFTAPQDLSPQIGEIIKIQFEVPGSEMMACYAIVTRIAEYSSFENEVAVHFYKLDRVQRINLVQGLAQKIDISQKKKQHSNSNHSNSSQQINLKYQDQALYMTLMIASILGWLTLIALYWR
ncbi:MAG: PilZ domain-containing protein [Pseudobdellovibrio sp.]